MPRLFTAIELPADAGAELYGLNAPLPGARWIKPDGYHLTLRFFGDIDNGIARELVTNLSEIDAGAFEFRISGLGVFGGNDPRTVWAGIEPSPQLEALARAHEKAARNAGLAAEKRTYRPHVTLARLKNSNAEAVARFLSLYSGYRSEPILAARTVLMSSKPLTGGGPYVIEDAFPLRGGGYMTEADNVNL